MHIPKDSTKSVDVLSFSDALERFENEELDFDNSKWMYFPPFYSEYRYVLGTIGNSPLICIGINPSTAKPDDLDNTLKSVQRIALSNGYDSFIMFNVYAQRATDPDSMEKEMNPFLHSENMKAFEYILSLSDNPSVWAAWGTIIEKRGYLKNCVYDMIEIGRKHNAAWYSCGARSKKKGHPHHPLYLNKDLPLDEFDIKKYLDDLE